MTTTVVKGAIQEKRSNIAQATPAGSTVAPMDLEDRAKRGRTDETMGPNEEEGVKRNGQGGEIVAQGLSTSWPETAQKAAQRQVEEEKGDDEKKGERNSRKHRAPSPPDQKLKYRN